MTSLLAMTACLAVALPADIPPPGPFDDGDGSGADWLLPLVGGLVVVALVAFVVVVVVIIRRRR